MKMIRPRYWPQLLVVVLLILHTLMPVGQVAAQTYDPGAQARQLLMKMTPEERVGQLFMVTLKGRDTGKKTQIYNLITRYHVGGVMLRAANDNFTGPDNTAAEVNTLVRDLQNVEWSSAQNLEPSTGLATLTTQYVPLLIGLSQEGDQYPYDQILNGLTPLPSSMAVGATWKTENAASVGEVLGEELNTLGINLLIGPSLDVLDVVKTEGGEDLGVRTFGGDPYWVGEMGRAYIQGVHTGSQGRVAVIAKHFPGRGESDRPPEDEVATVRKSLEQLKQMELAPFFSVTGNAGSKGGTVDGLLVSHIRYQGLQTNIRATTRPVSLDQNALDLVMSLTPLADWRRAGGVMVSDDLGSNALQKFYESSGNPFDGREVARTAFLAGNDLLYVDNFIATGDADAYTTIVRTLQYFAQKYREDPAFAQRVNISVERLLTLKFRLYPNFLIDLVTPANVDLTTLGTSSHVTFAVAQQAATLISPDPAELTAVLPRPPDSRDRIVFLTDTMTGRQCRECAETSVFAVDALQAAVVRLYGPHGSSQILPSRLSSYSFNDLQNFLAGNGGEPTSMKDDLQLANWVVIAMLDSNGSDAEGQVLRRFLSTRTDLLRNKRLVAFAFNAPYFLDATDISKLTAYYGLYSKTPAFVDVAVRLLFQEVTPMGALPVSMTGVGYDLITATSPDPNQIIPLFLDLPEPQAVQPGETPQPTPVPSFRVGDTLPLRTGRIYDHNRNLVPDGTVVRYLFTTGGGETGVVQQIETTTTAGVARATYRIQSSGLLEIRAVSDPANTSDLLRLDISPGGAAVITAIAPTVQPTATLEPTITPVPTLTPVSNPTPAAPSEPRAGTWMLAMLLIWGVAAAVFWMGWRVDSPRWGARWGLMTAAGGLLAYLYLVSGLPGSQTWLQAARLAGVLIATLIGMLVGWAGGWGWQRWVQRRVRRANGAG